ncbi:hypothetical protein MT997_11695 [Paenibacillus sp. OVF10]|nr:hypothetical protein MT997_11695 [Paenibacillus sp. OVF10]
MSLSVLPQYFVPVELLLVYWEARSSRNYIRAIEAMNDIKFTLFMNWKDGGDIEFYGAIMDKQGIESHYADLMLFNQFLWRKAKELEVDESSNLKRIDQVYEMIKGISKIFEVRAGQSSVETESIYFETDDATSWKGR